MVLSLDKRFSKPNEGLACPLIIKQNNCPSENYDCLKNDFIVSDD